MAQKSIEFGPVCLVKTPRNSRLGAGSTPGASPPFRSDVLGSELILGAESETGEALDVSKRLFLRPPRFSPIPIGG